MLRRRMGRTEEVAQIEVFGNAVPVVRRSMTAQGSMTAMTDVKR